jgi:hypothetical protein
LPFWAAIALCPLEAPGRSSCREKNTPTPHINIMIKKKIYGYTLKEQLIASAKDRLYNFSLAGGTVRGVIMNGTRMVNEMRANHELGILETLVLGRAYLGGALMTADLKGNDRISLHLAKYAASFKMCPFRLKNPWSLLTFHRFLGPAFFL